MNSILRSMQFLLLIIIALSIQINIVDVFATNNLIKNGDFETGDLNGWNIVGFSEVRQHNHTEITSKFGNHYIIFGSSNPNIKTESVVSQSFTIPKNQVANISFMYKVDNKSTLDVYLKQENGSIIHHWKFHKQTPWNVLTYHLDPNSSEKKFTLIFEGKGFTEIVNKSNCPVDPTKEEPDQGCGEGFFRAYYYPSIDEVKVSSITASENDLNIESTTEPEIQTSINTIQQNQYHSNSLEKNSINTLPILLIILAAIIIFTVYLFNRRKK